MFEALGQVGVELGEKSGFSRDSEADDNMPLKSADAAGFDGEVALVFFEFSDVVKNDTGQCQVGVDLWVDRE